MYPTPQMESFARGIVDTRHLVYDASDGNVPLDGTGVVFQMRLYQSSAQLSAAAMTRALNISIKSTPEVNNCQRWWSGLLSL